MKDGMSDDAMRADDVSIPKSSNKSKVSKETWVKIQAQYESGSYLRLEDLGSPYGLSQESISNKAKRDGWNLRQRALRDKVLNGVAKVAETEVQKYLTKAFKRSERLEQLIDDSIEQQPTNANGRPMVDTDQIDQITRSELRIHELAKSALRIVDTKQVEHTGGIAVFNVTEAIRALRAQPAPDLTPEELNRLKDCKIEGEEGIPQ